MTTLCISYRLVIIFIGTYPTCFAHLWARRRSFESATRPSAPASRPRVTSTSNRNESFIIGCSRGVASDLDRISHRLVFLCVVRVEPVPVEEKTELEKSKAEKIQSLPPLKTSSISPQPVTTQPHAHHPEGILMDSVPDSPLRQRLMNALNKQSQSP